MKKLNLLRWTFFVLFCAFYGFVMAQTTIILQLDDDLDYSNPEIIFSDSQLSFDNAFIGNCIKWNGTKSWDVTGWDGVTFMEINDRGAEYDAGDFGSYIDYYFRITNDNAKGAEFFQPTDLYVCIEYSGDSDWEEPAVVKFAWWFGTTEYYFDENDITNFVPYKAPDENGINAATYRSLKCAMNYPLLLQHGGDGFSIEIPQGKLDKNCNIGVANVVILGNLYTGKGTICDDFKYTISPNNTDDGAVSRLDEITVVTENSAIDIAEGEIGNVVVKDANKNVVAKVTGYEGLKYRNGLCYGYKLKLDNDIVTAGEYTISVAQGVFYIGYSNNVTNDEWTTTVTVDGSEDTELYYAPESGSTVEQLDKITISSHLISKNSSYEGDSITVVDYDRQTVDVEVNVEDVTGDDGSAMEITLDPAITEAGDYYINIPEGYFLLGVGQVNQNEALMVPFSVAYEFTMSPADTTVACLSEITVNANGQISINENKLSEVVVKMDGGEQVTHAASSTPITDDNGNITGYTLTLADSIVYKGNYTYTIPAGLFTCDWFENTTNHELDTVKVYVDGSEDTYTTLGVILKEPASEPESLSELSENYSVTVSLNDDYKAYDIFTLVLNIDNITTGENIVDDEMTRSGDSTDGYTYTWTNTAAETLASGCSYVFSVEVLKDDGVVGVFDLFTVSGTGSSLSETTVKSIDPEAGNISLSDKVFTLTFATDSTPAVNVDADSSYVKIDDNQYEFESIKSDDTYSDVWTLSVADTLMVKAAKNGGMDLVIAAKDKKGFPVGSAEAENLTYNYTVAKPVISYDDSLTVDTISAITLSSEYISLNANYEGDGILVLNGNDTVNVAVKAAKDSTTMTVSFSPAITLAGDYTIKIPEGYFLLGESQLYESDSLQLSRTIEYTFTASPSGELSTFKEITVLSNGPISVADSLLSGITVKTDSGERFTDAASYDAIKTVNNNVLEYRFNLSDTITAGGSYTYSIPEGLLTLGGTDSIHDAISENVTVSGTNEDKAVYTITPADGATVKSMSEFTVVADEKIAMNSDDLTSLHVSYLTNGTDTITITDSLGNETDSIISVTNRATVHVEAAEPIYNDGTVIGYTFTLEKEITDAGTYTITIPEGFFLTGDDEKNKIHSRKLSAAFEVDSGTTE